MIDCAPNASRYVCLSMCANLPFTSLESVEDSKGVVRSQTGETYFDGSIEQDIPVAGLAEMVRRKSHGVFAKTALINTDSLYFPFSSTVNSSLPVSAIPTWSHSSSIGLFDCRFWVLDHM